MNKRDLLVGPTVTGPVLDPLAVLHLDNRLYWPRAPSRQKLRNTAFMYLSLVNSNIFLVGREGTPEQK